MDVKLIPGEEFKRQAKRLSKKYPSLKDDLRTFQKSLKEDPNIGTDLGKGLRKVRMEITSKGKGKSGGARIITFKLEKTETICRIVLLTIYDKGEISNVSDNFLKSLIECL